MKQSSYKGKSPLPDFVIDAACAGNAEAVERVLQHYDGYINKLCTRTLYDGSGQPHICIDEYTFCTRMANAGMNPKALQYIMGHANIVMTLNYYAHATFHSAQEEMERLQAKAKPTAEAKPEPAAESAEETKAA